jgi:hypothetical protein
MGSWECYCAICGGPLGLVPEFGSNNPKALAARRQRIAKRRRRLAGEQGVHENDAEGRDEAKSLLQSDNIRPHHEQSSYNPEVIVEKDTEWLENCRFLGYNPDAEGSSKYVVD